MNGLHALLREPALALQLLLDGLWIGAPHALIAIGMALLWRLLGIINVAQGEFVMLGGFLALVITWGGLHPLLAMPLAMLAMFAFGWLLYRFLVRHLVDADLSTSLLALFGLSLTLQQLLLLAFGNVAQTAESGLGMSLLFGDMLVVPHARVLAFLLACLVGLGLWLLLRHARWRRAIGGLARATPRIMPQPVPAIADPPERAESLRATLFAINAALCGAAGSLLLLAWSVHPLLGLSHALRAFMLIIIGGIGNPLGIIAAAPALGMAEQFAALLAGSRLQLLSLFLLLMLALAAWRLAPRSRCRRGKRHRHRGDAFHDDDAATAPAPAIARADR